jgi:hypothetical protein
LLLWAEFFTRIKSRGLKQEHHEFLTRFFLRARNGHFNISPNSSNRLTGSFAFVVLLVSLGLFFDLHEPRTPDRQRCLSSLRPFAHPDDLFPRPTRPGWSVTTCVNPKNGRRRTIGEYLPGGRVSAEMTVTEKMFTTLVGLPELVG